MKHANKILLLLTAIAWFCHFIYSNPMVVQAQAPSSDGPVYVVQEGDSLWGIAARFRVSLADLAAANGLNESSQLSVGTRLNIPGLSGVQGELTTQPVVLGQSMESISRQLQVPIELLSRLNHMTSPAELYAGSQIILPAQNSNYPNARQKLMKPGESLLDLAVQQGINPWTYVLMNDLPGTWSPLPGEVLLSPSGSEAGPNAVTASAFPDIFESVKISEGSLVQGKMAVLSIAGPQGIQLEGSLDSYPLSFFYDQAGQYISLQGIHAMMDPGLHTLTIQATFPTDDYGTTAIFRFNQSILVSAGNYPYDPVLTVSPETIDPAVTKPEDAQWFALTATATPEKLWSGLFKSPVGPPYSDCWPSLYGNRRSYNGSDYYAFHTGLDFCGGVGTEILAPAAGRVVFTGPLTVRGNATVIDHGWGIYSGYLHQSEILVHTGDMVTIGQVIGKVGGTGRVTGPHLHWEIWAGGVQVDPMDWLTAEFP